MSEKMAFLKTKVKSWNWMQMITDRLSISNKSIIWSGQGDIFDKSIIQQLHNMVQYPDIVKHSGIPNRSFKIA